MAKEWKDYTPQEKADWFDNSVKYFQGLTEKQKQAKIREASATKRGMSRHKKRRWWHF